MFRFFKRKKPSGCRVLPAPKVMKVNIDFQFAKIWDVQDRIDVVLGQKFSLFTDSDTPVLWFANGDQVLSITERDTDADFEATSLGNSILQIMSPEPELKQLRLFHINIVSEISEPAKTLGLKAGQPEPKD